MKSSTHFQHCIETGLRQFWIFHYKITKQQVLNLLYVLLYTMCQKVHHLCINNTVKNDLFGFPKMKWLQYTSEVGKCTSYWCQIFSGFNTPKSLKLANFWQSYWKKYKGGHFLVHSVYRMSFIWSSQFSRHCHTTWQNTQLFKLHRPISAVAAFCFLECFALALLLRKLTQQFTDFALPLIVPANKQKYRHGITS